MFVLQAYAEGHSFLPIAKILKEKFDITMTRQGVRSVVNTESNQPHILNFRQAYLSRVKDVPIANKRVRIDDLEKIRNKLWAMVEAVGVPSTANKRREVSLLMNRIALTADLAREEMEKKPQLIAQAISYGGIGDKSDGELHRRKAELLREAERTLGGQAGRAGTDSEDFGFEGEGESP